MTAQASELSSRATRSLALVGAGFVLFILAPFTCLPVVVIGFGLLTLVAASVLAVLGIRDIRRSHGQVRGKSYAVTTLVVCSAIFVLSCTAIVDSASFAVFSQRGMACANNLKQLGAAMQAYADQNGVFPP